MVQFDGATPEEGVPRVQGVLEIETGHKVTHVRVGLFEGVPLTLPDRHHVVPPSRQEGLLLVDRTPHVIHASIHQTAPVPETPLELVRCVGLCVVPVHSVTCPDETVFALIPSMLDALTEERVVRVQGVRVGQGHHLMLFACVVHQSPPFRLSQTMFLPQQPFHGGFGVIGGHAPTLQGFHGNGVRRHPVHAQVAIASRRDGHLLEGIEMSQLFKVPLEGEAALFE